MAIGLNRVNKKKETVKTGSRKSVAKAARRPWRGLSEDEAQRVAAEIKVHPHQATMSSELSIEKQTEESDLVFDPLANLSVPLNLKFAFHNIEGASHWDLFSDLLLTRWNSSVHGLIKKSYWLSRATHGSSWLSRLQIYPRIKIPLPTWFTQRTERK